MVKFPERTHCPGDVGLGYSAGVGKQPVGYGPLCADVAKNMTQQKGGAVYNGMDSGYPIEPVSDM